MIKNIVIKDFRLFKNIEFSLGKYLTVISGRNATGKSTLLGMLGNSAELKKKDAIPLIQDQFRTEFREIFSGSPEFDLSGSDRYRVNFCDKDFNEITDYRDFRTSWQENQTRFRVIPYRKLDEGKMTEGKKSWPMLYLGLSRLFPIGESEKEGINSRALSLDDEDKKWFIKKYKHIISMKDNMKDISSINIGETNRKKGIGITTQNYNHLANSAGQDNLGQILCSILSFKKLKQEKEDEYEGGMLLIDEVDATLHPAAQNRLIDVLISECKKIDVQVVCTTHSISLLKHVYIKTRNNQDENNNKVELLYFTNANYKLQLFKNPSFNLIENELSISSIVQNKKKVKIYTEDGENRWFLKNIINEYLPRVELLDIYLGCNQLLNLRETDIKYFSNVIIILDGDVSDRQIEAVVSLDRSKIKNVLKLPGSKRPEEVIYEYILSLSNEHVFWKEGINIGFTIDYFLENGPEIYRGSEREKYKQWFKEHQSYFNSLNLYDYWEHDNKGVVSEFKEKFKEAFNEIAYRLFIPKIK